MNKKLVMIGLSIAVGSVMLLTTAFANATGTSGYDAYKSAIENTLAAKNLTESAAVTVDDNGKTLAVLNNTTKLNISNEALSQSTTIKIGDKTNTLESYRQDGKTVTKSSDSEVYNVMAGKPHKNIDSAKKLGSSKIKDGEILIDALVGNYQNYVTVDTKADGTREVSVQLSNSQLPAVINAAASVMIRNMADRESRMEQKGNLSSFKNDIVGELPKLTEDIRIDNVNLKAEISKDNYIVNQSGDITITGKDANGTAHSIKIDMNMNISGFNTTTPDKIDLTGKQVKTITPKFDRFRHSEEQGNEK